MEKPAPSTYPLHDLIRRQWSPRAFAPAAVALEELKSLLEAARWAPSCFGEEPWRYIIALRENAEEFDALLACLVEKNREWAKSAPVLMIGCTKKTFTRGGRINWYAYHDLGLASAQLTFEALSRGIFVHQMGGIDFQKIRETYGLPDDFDPVTGLALGYPGDAHLLPPAFQVAEAATRSRRLPTELFFSKLWGEPADFIKSDSQK